MIFAKGLESFHIQKVFLVVPVGGKGYDSGIYDVEMTTSVNLKSCTRCGQVRCRTYRAYSPAGVLHGYISPCERCGSQNYRGLHGEDVCTACKGHRVWLYY